MHADTLDEEGQKIVGDLTMFNDILERRLGATFEVLQSSTSDEERVMALEKYVNIMVSQAGRDSIRHTIAEIP